MRNKILWLSILGVALARPPNPVDSTATNAVNQQKQRSSRSIWPFVSSETTTEAPVTYPSVSSDNNNDWFLQGETALPQGIDLNKYPVWKVHKYNGIDLRPVNLQADKTYTPEEPAVDLGYSSGSSSSSDFSLNGYQYGKPDFFATGGQAINVQTQSAHNTHSTGYPAEQETYRTGEFQSSSFNPGFNQYGVPTQQKFEAYVPPQPLTDFRSTAAPAAQEPPKIPHAVYGLPNTYNAGSLNYQGPNPVGQRIAFSPGGGQSSAPQSQQLDEEKPDLSLLDDLGGLALFLPEADTDKESSPKEESGSSQQGFFQSLFSRFRGTSNSPATESSLTANKDTGSSGGFLSSVFGIRSSTQQPETGPYPTESSGSAFSSLFYQPETEKPAAVLPTTYYLPKTRGSYIAVKLPANVANSGFTPSIGPYNDVSNIRFHETPKVPFAQQEIPQISGPTLDSTYPYNIDYSEVRNSGFPGPAINADYQPSVVYGTVQTPSVNGASNFNQNYENYQPANAEVINYQSNQGEASGLPHAEYLQSNYNEQAGGVQFPSSYASPTINYNYQGEQHSQDSQNFEVQPSQFAAVVPGSQDNLSTGYPNTVTLTNVDESGINLHSEDHRYQSFNTANFDGQENFQNIRESVSLTGHEPVAVPQLSDSYVPATSYGAPIVTGERLQFDQQNSQRSITHGDFHDDHGDVLSQNFDSTPSLNHDLVPPKESVPARSNVPVYQTSISANRNPSNPLLPTTSYEILPVKVSNDFHASPVDENDASNRFIENLSALTSYGTPVNSYSSDSFTASTSNAKSVVVPAPTQYKVDDTSDIVDSKDVSQSTTSEQSSTKKAGRVLRKIMKRRNLVERNLQHARRSVPQRQAPTEETHTSVIIRSEKDSIPEVRGARQFDGTKVSPGYSKVQHQQRETIADTSTVRIPTSSAFPSETVQDEPQRNPGLN